MIKSHQVFTSLRQAQIDSLRQQIPAAMCSSPDQNQWAIRVSFTLETSEELASCFTLETCEELASSFTLETSEEFVGC